MMCLRRLHVVVSCMYDNHHWASDVLVGAAIGTFAGLEVVRYDDSPPGDRVDRLFLTGALTPEPGGGHSPHLSVLRGMLQGRPSR